MSDLVRRHYERYPYPHYPLLASVPRPDTYALNLAALWARFNGEYRGDHAARILIAGSGSFAPYPFAVANPGVSITALDLSVSSLRRARWHCLLHGITGVDFVAGDLCDHAVAKGPFAVIDAYGVLHHLDDPVAGLRALTSRLQEGGIMRAMVYSRFARREEESIRRALRLLHITEPGQVRRLARRSREGSRLRRFFQGSDEVSFRSGLADALLHPCVRTFRIDGFLDFIAAGGLEVLLFAHHGALPDVDLEVQRIRSLEAEGRSPGNFVAYLGLKTRGPSAPERSTFLINPCLAKAVGQWRLRPLPVAGRLGHPVPPLTRAACSFLSRFVSPVHAADLSPAELEQAVRYSDELFLLRYLKDK